LLAILRNKPTRCSTAIPIDQDDKKKWLGTYEKPEIPLDMKVRKKEREKKASFFSKFMEQTLHMLNDYKDRELLIAATLDCEEKACDIILSDEKKFFECDFEEQMKHEFLMHQPLVSQREFQHSVDNYNRDEKEQKILEATIRRIDKYDCTFLACKMIDVHIDDAWAMKIGMALRGNNFMQHLYLNRNLISDQGTSHIAYSLRDNWALKILNLSGNLIKDEGAEQIGEMLKQNVTLCELNLDFMEVSERTERSIEDVFV